MAAAVAAVVALPHPQYGDLIGKKLPATTAKKKNEIQEQAFAQGISCFSVFASSKL